ncbi:hypothetical protein [Azospirillum sp. ST 5-10]|uniref:hypothetical protein n=1 Tax=unclassified Azospirillum TaxID=2630922 RepID=UPI003F4A3DA2
MAREAGGMGARNARQADLVARVAANIDRFRHNRVFATGTTGGFTHGAGPSFMKVTGGTSLPAINGQLITILKRRSVPQNIEMQQNAYCSMYRNNAR